MFRLCAGDVLVMCSWCAARVQVMTHVHQYAVWTKLVILFWNEIIIYIKWGSIYGENFWVWGTIGYKLEISQCDHEEVEKDLSIGWKAAAESIKNDVDVCAENDEWPHRKEEEQHRWQWWKRPSW